MKAQRLCTYLVASEILLDAVQCLVKLGADLTQPKLNGATPLTAASYMKCAELVTWLVKTGSNLMSYN